MSNGIFNPTALSSTVFGIAGAGISLGLLAGMARNIQDITYQRPLTKVRRPYKYQYIPQRPLAPYKPSFTFKPYKNPWAPRW